MAERGSRKGAASRGKWAKADEAILAEADRSFDQETRQPLVGDLDSSVEIERRTTSEKVAAGERARARISLETLGAWAPAENRPDPVALLTAQESSRAQWLLPLRHARMAVSPFTFYRGAAAVMASDLSAQPATGLTAQVCGDAHLANFGIFGTPERRLVFDINDFDETLPGPWEWDMKRLAASLVIAARDRGFRKREQKAAAREAGRMYREAMADFARMPSLDVYYASLPAEQIIAAVATAAPKTVGRLEKGIAKAKTKTSVLAFERLTEVVDGERRIKSAPPLIYNFDDIPAGTTSMVSIDEGAGLLAAYRRSLSADRRRLLERYRVVDVALKVVGVGSVGTRCFIVLLEGSGEDDPLFLQVKQADASVLEPFLRKSRYRNHGQRVVEGQRLMQAASDIFLGWIPGREGRDFYWRQFKDWKGSADLEKIEPETLAFYAGLCGWTLARAHARSGSPLEMSAYLGEDEQFDEAMVRWAVAYADQNEADYARFMDAISLGELAAADSV